MPYFQDPAESESVEVRGGSAGAPTEDIMVHLMGIEFLNGDLMGVR